MTASRAIYSDETPPEGAANWFRRFETGVTVFGVLMFTNMLGLLIIGVTAKGNPDVDLSDAAGFARLTWYPAYLLILIVSIVQWKKIATTLPRVWPIAALFALALLSINWSISPDLTQRRVIALFFTLHFGVYLAVRAPLLSSLRIIGGVWLFAGLVCLSLITLAPSLGIDQRVHVGAWRGFFTTKNLLGGEMARAHLVFFALLFLDGRYRSWWWAGLALTGMLVIGSTSTTALMAMVIPYTLYIVHLIAKRSVIASLFAIWASVSAIGLVYFVLTTFSAELVQMVGKDLTFTGRTPLWEQCFHYIALKPWTGYGYAAFWKTEGGPAEIIMETLQWDIPTAHNSWVEVALSMGYPAMALMIFTTFVAFTRSITLMTGRHGPTLAMILLQLVMVSMSESLLLEQNFHSTMLFAFVVAASLVQARVPDHERAEKQRNRDLKRNKIEHPEPIVHQRDTYNAGSAD